MNRHNTNNNKCKYSARNESVDIIFENIGLRDENIRDITPLNNKK